MNKLFCNNLINLHRIGRIVAILAVCFSVFPFIEKDWIKAGFCIFSALISMFISFYSNFQMQQINVKNRVIYVLITLFFANIIAFAVFQDLWPNTHTVIEIFPSFLICALLMFVNPPRFVLFLTAGSVLIFISTAFFLVSPLQLINYITSSLIAGAMSLFFNWQITKLRFGLEISSNMLEDERNKYLDQSTVDELTQLKNRRDFMNTFQRYLSNYRTSDAWLCIALADIDFFKFYNDHYGHPQGDVCLRSIGAVLNKLCDDMAVYAARVGGEEFAVIWFERDISNVNNVINHWTKMIKDQQLLHEKSKVSDFVTMSIGVYITRCGSHHDTQALYDLADKALYAAKGGGRNCAVITGDDIKQYKLTPSS